MVASSVAAREAAAARRECVCSSRDCVEVCHACSVCRVHGVALSRARAAESRRTIAFLQSLTASHVTQKPLDWDDLRYMLALARTGSLAAAGKVLGVDP